MDCPLLLPFVALRTAYIRKMRWGMKKKTDRSSCFVLQNNCSPLYTDNISRRMEPFSSSWKRRKQCVWTRAAV